MTDRIHKQTSTPGVSVIAGEPRPVDYDAVVVLPFHPVYGRLRAERAQEAGQLTDTLNALWQECWRDQQTVDGAPAVIIMDGPHSLTVIVRGDTPHALKRGGFLEHAFPSGIR